MLETLETAAVAGLDVRRVRVEVSISRGTPMIRIVGLAQGAVREGRERIRAAASHLDVHVPGLRITVNLAPADIPKSGTGFDLPIVIGILSADGQIPSERLRGALLIGELGLDGSLRPVRGALPIALHAGRAADIDRLILPIGNLREAEAATGVRLLGARTLPDVIAHLGRGTPLAVPADLPPRPRMAEPVPDLASIRGQQAAKRALEVAAAGGHNLLMIGAPGSGKTSLARCLPGLLPPLTPEEAVEVTAVHSVAGVLPEDAGLVDRRPFRAPHHTVSEAGLIGGGGTPRPGEASLAHRGVLFLDELPEFRRSALEALRQPLEEGVVHLVRARASATYPARFALVAAMNPCPCGRLTLSGASCACPDGAIRRYRSRLSGPLLDRIDMHVEMPAVTWEELDRSASERVDGTAEVASRISAVRARLRGRSSEVRDADGGEGGGAGDGVCAIPCLDRGSRALLREAVDRFGLSARGVDRAVRVARTIAALDGRPGPDEACLAEALRYRRPA